VQRWLRGGHHADLKKAGQYKTGYYLVRGDQQHTRVVFCNMTYPGYTNNDSQQLVDTPCESITQLKEDMDVIKTKMSGSEYNVEGLERSLESLTSDMKRLATSWTPGSYCVLANGDCPPGFSRASGSIHALSVWSCTGSTAQATLGSSFIRHHRQCTHGNYADITIVTCCK